MRKLRKKIELDITPYHVRNQMWRMSLLKFYRTIEYDENIYNEFARKLLDNKIDQKTLDKLDKLRKEQHVWDSVLETYIDKSKKVSGYYINDGKIKILYERKV